MKETTTDEGLIERARALLVSIPKLMNAHVGEMEGTNPEVFQAAERGADETYGRVTLTLTGEPLDLNKPPTEASDEVLLEGAKKLLNELPMEVITNSNRLEQDTSLSLKEKAEVEGKVITTLMVWAFLQDDEFSED